VGFCLFCFFFFFFRLIMFYFFVCVFFFLDTRCKKNLNGTVEGESRE